MKFGPCCVCERTGPTVRVLVMLDFEAPPGFHGWSCLLCGLEDRGALAVVCDACADCMDVLPKLRFIAGGHYLEDRVRVPLAGFERRPFDHVLARHPESKLLLQ